MRDSHTGPWRDKARRWIPSSAAGLFLATALLGSARADQVIAWSDAGPRLSASDAQVRVEAIRRAGCAGPPSASAMLREYEAQLAALPVDSPLRPTYETILKQLREAAAKEGVANPPVPSAPSLNDALSSARRWLEANEPAGMKAFSASADGATFARASTAALQASLAGRPTAALAALLAAQTLNPGDSGTLVNLGGVLATLKLSREALGVLDAAGALKAGTAGAMGWSSRAVALNNRALALLDLGRAGEALPALQEALRLSPDLAEARTQLGRALACAGRLEEAATVLRTAGRRSVMPSVPATPLPPGAAPLPAREMKEEDDPEGLKASWLPSEWVFDVSRGRPMNLPNLKLPLTPTEAVELHDGYQKLRQDLDARALGISKRQQDLTRLLQGREASEPPLVLARRHALTMAVYGANRAPRVRPLWAQANRAHAEVSRIQQDFWHCEGGCEIDMISRQARGDREVFRRLCVPALEKANNSWRAAMQLYATHLAKATEAEYRLQTGLAANSSDPLWHELASLSAEHTAVEGLNSLVQLAAAWSTDVQKYQDLCLASAPTPSTEPVAAPLTVETSSLCSGAVSNLSLSVSIKVVSISVSCDKASIKLASPGWIGAFGKVDRSFVHDQYTVSAGVEAGVELPLTSAGVKAATGFYVTLDSELNFRDAGISADARASLGEKIGPVKVSEADKGFGERWSFVSAP